MGINSIWGLIPLFVLKIHLGINFDYIIRFPFFVLKNHLGINSGPDNIQYLGFN